MNPDQTKELINDIYATVDRAMVVQEVVGAGNFRDTGGYISFVCPACGQYKGYVRKPSGRHAGNTVQCSRANCEMSQPMTLIDFVAGTRKARGNDFKRSIQILAGMIGRDYSDEQYKPLPKERRKQLQRKIEAKIPEGYYDPKPELEPSLKRYQKKVDRKVVTYLNNRGIPYELANEFGVGFAKFKDWCHFNDKGECVRQWIQGRVVFPVYNDKGQLMNLYGRALEDGSRECPKAWKHDFLPGTKGIGNQKDLKKTNVHIVEGYFDLLSIKAARPTANVSAVFGVHGFDWDLVDAKYVCFCFDDDVAGGKWKKIADEGLQRGKEIYWLDKASYGGYNDLNAVWKAKGKINFRYKKYVNVEGE